MGECQNYVQRWYYDSYEGQCRQYYYGGCGGNENNFQTEQDCVNRCKSAALTVPPPGLEFRKGNASGQLRKLSTFNDIELLSIILELCFLSDEHGPCSDNQIKWFYDSRDGICKQFRYGGCQSNGNNFNTREECEYRCGEAQGTELQKLRAEKLFKMSWISMSQRIEKILRND